MINSNLEKFGNIVLGVHGKELPKFTDKESPRKEWWIY